MKKLINHPEAVVEEMIQGLLATCPGLVRLAGQRVLLRADIAAARERQVMLIAGGGSGHEPAHAGYIGEGMLAAAVLGDVFTSPPVEAVLAAIRACAGRHGVLLIVKNYTGDRLNFGIAAELARAEGIAVEMAVVADDVALAATHDRGARRGIAGTVLVHKIAGAAAAEGRALAEVAALAQAAADAVATIGVALSACTVPAAGKPSFSLAADEVEVGLGIHGEPGVRKAALRPADETVDELLQHIAAAQPLQPGDRVALLVNNLAATTHMELAIVARRAVAALGERGLVLERVYVGTFMSALEMAGVSLSVLRLDEARLRWLDAPCAAPAWPNAAAPRGQGGAAPAIAVPDGPARTMSPLASPETGAGRALSRALAAAAAALLGAEAALTELDRQVGDGDLGLSMARGARALEEAAPALPFDDAAATLHDIGRLLQQTLGGSSGPLYAAFFLRAAASLRTADPAEPRSWAAACRAGIAAVSELGGAQAGDRTMLDALVPFANALEAGLQAGLAPREAWRAAADAAEAGAAATAAMFPRRGRSSYLGARALGVRDPGAQAIAIWLRAALADPP